MGRSEVLKVYIGCCNYENNEQEVHVNELKKTEGGGHCRDDLGRVVFSAIGRCSHAEAHLREDRGKLVPWQAVALQDS